ncbi:Uncharacterised protein [Oligella urethralis]|nr:hypothetical protein [Oligella urethralis]SUA61299.1 Uncharacterised protein [Oligella urethralis]
MNTVNQPENQSSEAMTQEEYERDHPEEVREATDEEIEMMEYGDNESDV